MSHWKLLPAAAVALFALAPLTASNALPASGAAGQINVNIGVAPACPYGYYDYAPYNCAAYGYYGPDWFNGGIFIGAGPWFRGRSGFYGHVDNRYDPRHGYAGPFPDRGERAFNHFHGNEGRDGRGHIGDPGHDAGLEHAGGFSGGGHPGGFSGGRHR